MMPGRPVDPNLPVTAQCPNCHRMVELIPFERIGALCFPVHLTIEPLFIGHFTTNICPNGADAMTMAATVAARMGDDCGSPG